MIAADPVLVARNADPVSAASLATAAAPAETAGSDGDFALALAQMMGAATGTEAKGAAVPTDMPPGLPEAAIGAAVGAEAMLDDLGRVATLVPEPAAAATPMPTAALPATALATLPEAAMAGGAAAEAALHDLGGPDLGVMPDDKAAGAVADVPAGAAPTEVAAKDAVAAVAPEDEGEGVDGGVDGGAEGAAKPEDDGDMDAASAGAAPVVLPVMTLPKPEAAVVVAAAVGTQAAAQAGPKAKADTLTEDAPIVAAGQTKLPRGAKPVKDSAPSEKEAEAAPKKDVEEQADDSATPAQRARAVMPEGVAVAAIPARGAEDAIKLDARAEAVGAAAEAPAPTSGGLMPAASNLTQASGQAPVMTDRPGWEAVIAERIAADLSEDGSLIEMELSPDNLGNLKITLDLSTGEAQVRFVTETPEAARLIQQNEHRLSDALSRAGLSLGGHETTSRDPQGDRSGRGAGGGAGGGGLVFERAAEATRGRAPGAVPSGIVNLIA